MRKLRAVLAGAVTVGVLGAMASTGAASAATTGVGTASASTSLLKVSLGNAGSVLAVRVLGDDSSSTIDPAVSTPSASTRLVPLTVSSAVVPALNVSLAPVESTSSGPQTAESSPAVDLTTAATGGTLNPFSIVSQVDPGLAHSQLSTSVDGLTVAGGLLDVPSALSALSTSGGADKGQGLRGIQVPSVTVLDLSSLLEGLGIDLTDLPVGTLTDLVSTLGLTVPGVGSGEVVQQAVDDLDAAIDDVQLLLTEGGGTVDQVLGLLDPLGGLVDTTPVTQAGSDVTAAANAALDELQATLGDLLTNLLQTLDGAALLKVTDIDVGLSTTATGTLDGSSAAVAAKLGGITVGNLALGGVDVAATAGQVAAVVQDVESKVGGVLDDVDPGLADLVDVALFQKATDVSSDQSYVTASASLTALVATIVPPADITTIVNQVVAGTGVDETLAGLGLLSTAGAGSGRVHAASVLDGVTPMSTLNRALGNIDALAAGAEVRVLDFSSISRFAPQGGVTPGSPAGELPRTGGDHSLPLAVLGAALLGLALTLIRRLRTPTTVR